MDAVEFIRERKRMCDSFSPDCEGCRIDEAKPVMSECFQWMLDNPEKAVSFIERWSAVHPRKTRQSEFLKMFSTANLSEDGVPTICPAQVDASERDEKTNECGNMYMSCVNCKREFWMQEIK